MSDSCSELRRRCLKAAAFLACVYGFDGVIESVSISDDGVAVKFHGLDDAAELVARLAPAVVDERLGYFAEAGDAEELAVQHELIKSARPETSAEVADVIGNAVAEANTIITQALPAIERLADAIEQAGDEGVKCPGGYFVGSVQIRPQYTRPRKGVALSFR